MQRGGGVEEELLAISPPPEFQDSPAPPPPVFRDLSPFPRGLGEGTTAAVGNRKSDSHPQPLRDFADRISFDILNEAMVIATEEVLSDHHGGSNRNSSVTAPATDHACSGEFPFSSDSSDDEENPVSTTTSWEYLSKASSWSDLRCLRATSPQRSRLHTSPRHQNHRTCRNNKPDSINSIRFITNSSSSNHNSASFRNEKPSTTHHEQSPVTRSASFHTEALVPNLNLLSTTQKNSCDLSSDIVVERPVNKTRNRSADDNSTCYNVPYQCDIYSLPIDNILPRLDDHNIPTTAPKRSRCRGTSQNFRVPLGQNATNISEARTVDQPAQRVPSSSSKHENQSDNNCQVTLKNPIQPSITLDSTCGHLQVNCQAVESSNTNTNTNFDNQRAEGVSSRNRSFRPPRSRSVEMSNSGNNLTCRQNNSSSQNSNFPIETNSSLVAEHCAGKTEKRTLGHSILNLFKRNKPRPLQATSSHTEENHSSENRDCTISSNIYRALPLPPESNEVSISVDAVDPPPPEARDFAASIEKVKDCGWYWGPLSSEAAEDLLRGEPDGSFIVRDSSDAHYIFSLTFKLNGLVRHVRIEHDQGNFSFGPLTRFKASTIVDFVEKAVAHSRSGRYLFFLHRRPVLGPMRVQLLHPYSRFRHPRSLQHMCRFVILKYVRRDLIHTLPLPKPLQDYLNTPHYYFEQHEQKKNTS